MIQLSPQQKKAVKHMNSPALVVAGAGSGKTRTLTAKIDYLIKKGYEPDRILAITFTNKAAEEMKNRLEDLTGLKTFQFPWVRTYHSACFRILKEYCHVLGYEKPIQIYSAYHQQKTVKDILMAMNYDKKHVQAVMSQISNAKNFGSPSAYFDKNFRVSRIRVKEVFQAYEQELRSKNAVDFDNILLKTRDILRDHKDIRQKYQELFQYILVDEYQDSNNLQEELTRLMLKSGNLFCVGDDWQAIYGFRGSNISHFLTFPQKYPKAKVFRLEENYRSADEIVQIANELIEFNQQKMDKKCFSKKQGGVVTIETFSNEYQESQWIAHKIKSLRARGIIYDQIAVLYRTKFCSLAFEKTFRTLKIPYQMMGAKGFFERKEILDLNCYLTAAMFHKDDAAFERILNTPKRGIGPKMIQKINQVRIAGMSLQDAARKILAERVMSPKVHTALSQLIQYLDLIIKLPPKSAIEETIKQVGYMAHLEQYVKSSSGDYTAREENIEQLKYSASQHLTISDYLEEVSLVREDKEDEEEESDFGVKLSTVHASKGLEYKAVFIAGCEESLFPHWKSADTPAGIQEERRLMYVAITRAEKYLYITRAKYRQDKPNPQSRFLDEIAT